MDLYIFSAVDSEMPTLNRLFLSSFIKEIAFSPKTSTIFFAVFSPHPLINGDDKNSSTLLTPTIYSFL